MKAPLHVHAPDDALAEGPPPQVPLDRDTLDRIARLALKLTQRHARGDGHILSPAQQVPYEERDPLARAAMRAGVVRVVQALILLGYIEP